MIITSGSIINSTGITRTCWNGIRRFHNVTFVADLICKLHSVKKDKNIIKQAEQIKYCLIQAKEYYDAAQAVSLATKPVLMYYPKNSSRYVFDGMRIMHYQSHDAQSCPLSPSPDG